MGQMLAAPLFDLLLDRRRTREVLCLSMFVLVIGSLLYVVGPARISVIMMSRFLIGVAAGAVWMRVHVGGGWGMDCVCWMFEHLCDFNFVLFCISEYLNYFL